MAKGSVGGHTIIVNTPRSRKRAKNKALNQQARWARLNGPVTVRKATKEEMNRGNGDAG